MLKYLWAKLHDIWDILLIRQSWEGGELASGEQMKQGWHDP